MRQGSRTKGYDVTAFVRDPSKLPGDLSYQIKVKVGDSTNEYDVDDAVMGQDAVVVALGTRNDLSPTSVMSDSTKLILEAMCKYGVARISACMSAFNFREKSMVPPQFHNILEDHERMIVALRESDREWIAVLPPHIEPNVEIGTGDYLVKRGSQPGRVINKHDLGHFLVTCIEDDRNVYQMCSLCDRPN
ncbi:flavin reductase (NADPH)-like isoform X2 [Oratosquilla oratoria]|uniref:flavin reductase (NADPH)-like isoform X2 n=1 Tax=Oratosquilla oratoria TaxID=337810 RepID=UPI003F75D5EB